MKAEKTYTIIKSRSGRSRNDSSEITGTLEYLTNYFSYTLEIGASWNKKINRYPKTIKSFISNVQMAFEEKEACCYDRTHIELKQTVNAPVEQIAVPVAIAA